MLYWPPINAQHDLGEEQDDERGADCAFEPRPRRQGSAAEEACKGDQAAPRADHKSGTRPPDYRLRGTGKESPAA